MFFLFQVSLAVFPPPPEFSTGPASLGVGAPPYGSIFIAVSVGRDPNADRSRRDLVDVSGRPDLLDLSHRTVGTVTLPRRRPPSTVQLPHYDNMGPRVTAGGNSTLSLPDCDQEVVPPPVPHQLMLQPYVAPPQRNSEFVSL
nr:unnamed protein product [Callosobruchus analis]